MSRKNRNTLLRLKSNKNGAALVEYAILLILLSVASLGTVKIVGDKVKEIFTTTTTEIEIAEKGAGPTVRGTPGDDGMGGPEVGDGSGGDGSEAARLFPHIAEAENWPDPSSCFQFVYRENYWWDTSETDPARCFFYDGQSNAGFSTESLSDDMFVYFGPGKLTQRQEGKTIAFGDGHHTVVVDPADSVTDHVSTPIEQKKDFYDVYHSHVGIDHWGVGSLKLYIPNYTIDSGVIVDKFGGGWFRLWFRNGASLDIDSYGQPMTIQFKDRLFSTSELDALPNDEDIFGIEAKYYGGKYPGGRGMTW
jgi:Flp pilus assembly pilin Flp